MPSEKPEPPPEEVLSEQFCYLIAKTRFDPRHGSGCACQDCWRFDRMAEILMMPFWEDYYEVGRYLKHKATKKKAGGSSAAD